MALSHFAYVRRNVISGGVAVAMAATMAFPAVALANSTNGSEEDSAASHSASLESGVSVDETDANSAGESQTNYVAETTGVQVNKEDYYSEEGSPEALISLFSMGRSASSLRPVNLSTDVTYFGAYEGGSYAQTLSSGDGFHAVGYYQFDNRYGLLDFIRAVYAYDPSKYSMFEQFNYIADSTFEADNAMRQNGQFTALGVALNSSWKAAYAADAEEFSRLQDGWEYIKYIEPALDYLDSRGIDIYSRADAVQGLCASLCNLFGPSGWHKFVGGYSDGYDWNGFYNSWKYWDGCGLNNDMTDAEFVSTSVRLCRRECWRVLQGSASISSGLAKPLQAREGPMPRDDFQTWRYPCESGRCDRARSEWLSWRQFFVEWGFWVERQWLYGCWGHQWFSFGQCALERKC